MLKKILTALVCICILVLILMSDKIVLPFAAVLVSFFALHELYDVTGVKKNIFPYWVGILLAIPICFSYYLPTKFITCPIIFLLLMLFAMLLFKKATVHDILVTIFGNIYIPFLLSLAILTRKIVPYGEYYIWLPFFGAYVTDATAYFGGTFYGKHKLSPKISPNKTVEGSIIGTISCVISFWLIYVVYFYLFHVPVKFLSLTILSIISSIVSQLGDLFASAIKRYYHIKDFSNLLPGHGGALDRIDSLLFAIPVVYFYVIIFRIV